MTISEYLERINKRFITGISREHSYRGDLQTLLESLADGVLVTNEPSRIKCGAPDFIITKQDIPVGYIEAKDIGKDLSGKEFKEQFSRYRKSLNNLMITDYLEFKLYIDGEFVTSKKIAEISDGKIIPLPDNFEQFASLVKAFCVRTGQTITNSKKLAEMMAGKAQILASVIENALKSDEETNANSTLKDQMKAFQDVLIHDLEPKQFADIYAQTIAYGMFAARLHDPNLPSFSRQEAAELIPKSNPFLRKLFQHIAGYDLDDRIKWIVDALADIFRATDVKALLKNFGKSTQANDPIIHFYETFLAAYDPKLRKSRGVWYTPEPVVNFIVRAVDDILKTEFGLKQGLADTTKTKIKLQTQTRDQRTASGFKEIEKEVHKVQILDPATGTGTFLAEVVKQIYKKFEGQEGIWSKYVENDLIPRLNGFELLMASYTMAHLKLDMLLSETGYKPTADQRFKIYLTNSLEEHHPDTGTLFSGWLSREANEANHIKRDTPVMCVIGNPPYNGESVNKGKWIMGLMEDYKKEPGGIEKLNEDNSKWINADEYKFLRFGQHFIEKNNEGILTYINPHSFLDNPTFRGMRWHLLKTYDKIFIIDLHGNSIKKEKSPDGTIDKNVFDIKQGVSINIFIKTGRKKSNELAEVFHYDKYGTREVKYKFLWENNLKSIKFNSVDLSSPEYFFVKKNLEDAGDYKESINLVDLFKQYSLGVLSKNDSVTIEFEKEELENRIKEFKSLSESDLRNNYNLKKDSRDWVLKKAINDLKVDYSPENYKKIVYRPFDNRWTYFTGKPKGFFAYSQNRIMRNLRVGTNYALIIGRQGQAVGQMRWNLSFITNTISDQNIYYRGGGSVLPLYLYPETDEQQDLLQSTERTPNLNEEIVGEIAEKLGLKFVSEKEETTPSAEAAATPPKPGGELGTNAQAGAQAAKNSEKNLSNLPYLKTFRRELRNNLTPAEAKFWKVVQNKNLEGRKFRRQHSVGNYILDFYCPSEKLAIELDGEVHFGDKAQVYDRERRLFLEHFGIKVLRFENKLIFEELPWVLDFIKSNFGWTEKEQPPRQRSVGTPPQTGGELNPQSTGEELNSRNTGGKFSDSGSPPSQGGVAVVSTDGVVALRTKKIIDSKTFAPIDILDYIYAVLHSPTYREKYKEFLKIDFPRVPYPKDAETFWQLVRLGGELRKIHLLESPRVEEFITTYPNNGDNIVTRKMTKRSIGFEETKDRIATTPSTEAAATPPLEGGEKEETTPSTEAVATPPQAGGEQESLGRVWINDEQYFDNVPKTAWEFYIGGYQPAQKWLKDRCGRELSYEDIRHYQKIIVALSETHRLMKEIDLIDLES